MTVLITGGAGFIGSWLVESLLAVGDRVVVLDNLSPQIHGTNPDCDVPWLDATRGVTFVRGDIRDAGLVDSLLSEVEAVVHLAAETGTGQSMYQIGHYYSVNVQATAQLFEAIGTRHRHVKHVVLASSRSIYGEGAYRLGKQLVVPAPRDAKRMAAGLWEPLGPNGEALELVATPESARPRPASVYAATKLANEQLGRVFAEAYGTSVTALRLQNVYGERQSLRNPYTGILSIFSNRMRKAMPINIFEDGLESRDFVHVSDVVRSIELSMKHAGGGYRVFNIGSGVPTTVIEMARALARTLKSSSELQISGDFRAGDIRHCYADRTRARAELGFEPLISLKEGLSALCGWVVRQEVVEDLSDQAQRELSRLGLGKAS